LGRREEKKKKEGEREMGRLGLKLEGEKEEALHF